MSLKIKLRSRRNRSGLLKLRGQLEVAEKAHDLLEEKLKILKQEVRRLSEVLESLKREERLRLKDAYKRFYASILSMGLIKVSEAASFTDANDEIELRWGSIRGVVVPKLVPKIRRRSPIERGYDIRETNYDLDKASEAFEQVLIVMVRVAEQQEMYRILNNETRRIEIRVSALEKILIPSLEREIKVIENRLEEKERENHVLIKWIKEHRSVRPEFTL